jgi:vacuolar-type H+-ATPase subunit D/Vma8
MEQVSATRSELLARRARIALATQGRDLLKERRTALVREFHRLGASALESMDALDRNAADAGRYLGVTVAAAGPEPLHSAALAAQGDIELSVRTRSVAEFRSSRHSTSPGSCSRASPQTSSSGSDPSSSRVTTTPRRSYERDPRTTAHAPHHLAPPACTTHF